MTRTKFDVLREIREIESEIQERNEEAADSVAPRMMSPQKMMRLTQLRHELKMFGTVRATGKAADKIKEHWQRQAEEEQKKIEKQKLEDKNRLEQAKKEVREEIKDELSEEELKTLLAKKRAEKHA